MNISIKKVLSATLIVALMSPLRTKQNKSGQKGDHCLEQWSNHFTMIYPDILQFKILDLSNYQKNFDKG